MRAHSLGLVKSPMHALPQHTVQSDSIVGGGDLCKQVLDCAPKCINIYSIYFCHGKNSRLFCLK